MRHNDAGVRVRLEGGPGLFGFVPADYVTDDVLPTDPITGQVRTCALLLCRVTMLVLIVSGGEDLRDAYNPADECNAFDTPLPVTPVLDR